MSRPCRLVSWNTPGILLQNLCIDLQDSSPKYGAKNFSNNAPSWEALQHMVNEKAKILNWQQPDLEAVCMHQLRLALCPQRVQSC